MELHSLSPAFARAISSAHSGFRDRSAAQGSWCWTGRSGWCSRAAARRTFPHCDRLVRRRRRMPSCTIMHHLAPMAHSAMRDVDEAA
jgi:hypothetical protein